MASFVKINSVHFTHHKSQFYTFCLIHGLQVFTVTKMVWQILLVSAPLGITAPVGLTVPHLWREIVLTSAPLGSTALRVVLSLCHAH